MHTTPSFPTDDVIDAASYHDVRYYANLINLLLENCRKAVIGQETLITGLVIAVLTGRGVGLTGVPGIAKTAGCKALAHSLGHRNDGFARVQCTNDQLPSDFTGSNFYHPFTGEVEFRPGPLFKAIVLLDEINRAAPRTLSGTLEALEERQVTVDGVTYPLSNHNVIVATWNPDEHAGTQTLPDAVRDRFDYCVRLTYPDAAAEQAVALGQNISPEQLRPVLNPDQVMELQEFVAASWRRTAPAVAAYAVRLIQATRTSTSFKYGASPRASQALLRIAACYALLKGKNAPGFDEVREAFLPTIAHRLDPDFESWGGNGSRDDFIEKELTKILETVQEGQ